MHPFIRFHHGHYQVTIAYISECVFIAAVNFFKRILIRIICLNKKILIKHHLHLITLACLNVEQKLGCCKSGVKGRHVPITDDQ